MDVGDALNEGVQIWHILALVGSVPVAKISLYVTKVFRVLPVVIKLGKEVLHELEQGVEEISEVWDGGFQDNGPPT